MWVAHSLQFKRTLSASDYFTIDVTSNLFFFFICYLVKSRNQIKLQDVHRLQKVHKDFKSCSEKIFCMAGKKTQQNRAWPCNSLTHQQNILSLYKEKHNVLLAQGTVFYFFPGNSCQKFC